MISENEHLRQRMLFSRLDDEWYLVTSKGLADEFDGFINARKRSIFAIIPK